MRRSAAVLTLVLLASAVAGQGAARPPATLEEAARANDYPTFHALFERDPEPAFAPLHELWTYSMSERGGAFYGREMYQRLSSRYPSFAAYMADHRIADGRGNVIYPVAETKAFLLARAVEGTVVAPLTPERTGAKPSPQQKPASSERPRMKKS